MSFITLFFTVGIEGKLWQFYTYKSRHDEYYKVCKGLGATVFQQSGVVGFKTQVFGREHHKPAIALHDGRWRIP